ncbi:MAG: PHB depolymerase family esterase [Polyangiales bacterium]
MRRAAFFSALCALSAACSEPAPTAAPDAASDLGTDTATPDVSDVPDAPPDAEGLDASVDVATVDDAGEDAPDVRVRVVPTEWPASPPPFPSYSGGACPTLMGGPTSAAGLNPSFPTGDTRRQFRLIVPRAYDPEGADRWPLVFAWHWLAGDSAQMVREADLERSAENERVIVVVPDQQRNPDGNATNLFTWPFLDRSDPSGERVFFDDLLACVSAQYRVDPTRVHAMGVSAGALWVTALTSTERARHFASVAILSGGLGEVPSTLHLAYAPQPNRYPAIVLWGGPTDRLIVDFNAASIRLRDALVDHGHFVVACTHDRGHALPPLPPPGEGESRFQFVWDFFRDHPYGMRPATSPWIDAGLPPSAPTWCAIPPEITGG